MSYGNALQNAMYNSSPPFVKNAITTVYGWRQKRRRFGPDYYRYYQQIEDYQWLGNEELLGKQLESVKLFLAHAENNSEYYKRVLGNLNISAKQIRGLSDLKTIPILEKVTLRNNIGTIIPRNMDLKKTHWSHTGGTTGFGLVFRETAECFQREYAFRFQNYSCGGIHVGDKWAFCAGHPVAGKRKKRPPFWTYDYSNRWLLMSSYHMTEKNLPLYIRELEKFSPALLGGYPSSIYLLALANEHCGKVVHPRAIYTSSETLFRFQREAIQRSFGCKVYTYYGNGERAGFIAECPEGSLHVKLDHSLVELVNDKGEDASPGEIGRLICTAFGNVATPLIRYNVGDTAILSSVQECPCARGGMLIEELTGRTEDYVVTPDGRFVGRLDHLFKDSVKVRAAQIVQDKVDTILIRIVKEHDYSSRDESEILREATSRLGDDIDIDIEYVSDIERAKSGKHRFIISNLSEKRIYGRGIRSVD